MCRERRSPSDDEVQGQRSRHVTRSGGQPRFAVVRRRGRWCVAAHAVGGGRPNTSGTMGWGARNIVATSAGRSRLRWRAGTYDAGEDLLGVGALAGAVAAAHLADDDGGSDGLFGALVGGVDRRVPEEREDGGEFAGQMGGKALGVVQRRRVVDQPAEPGEQSAAGGGQTVVAQTAGVAPVAQREAGLQDVVGAGDRSGGENRPSSSAGLLAPSSEDHSDHSTHVVRYRPFGRYPFVSGEGTSFGSRDNAVSGLVRALWIATSGGQVGCRGSALRGAGVA